MMHQKLLDEYIALPADAQHQVADFIDFLRQRYKKDQTDQKAHQTDLESQPFVGMWRNRQELSNSSNWVRNIRKSEWGEEM